MVSVEPIAQELGGEWEETGQTDQAAGQAGDSRASQRNGLAAALQLTEPGVEGVLPLTDYCECMCHTKIYP